MDKRLMLLGCILADDVRNTGSMRRSYDQDHFDEGLKDGG